MQLQTLIRLLYAKHFVNRMMHSGKNFTTYDEYVVQAYTTDYLFLSTATTTEKNVRSSIDMLNRVRLPASFFPSALRHSHVR